jgi:polysaccharide chain length determinant protein (PEP-CTERM system associated)
MPLRPNMEPMELLDIIRRRKWTVLFSFLLILFGAMVYCVLVPDLYRSSTKILIIPPTVAEGMVQSTANLNARNRLAIIETNVLSRSRLMGVIGEMGISVLGFAGKSEDDMVDIMRDRIKLDVGGSEGNIFTFILSFEHGNPQVAQSGASRLASLFIDENVRNREAVTQGTAKFLESQLEETRIKLVQQEEKMKQYKLHFGGELPQQEQSNLNRLSRLQDQIKSNAEAMARLQDRKLFLEAQISNLESSIRTTESTDGSADQLLADLAVRRKKLEELNEKYTPLHPSLVQTRSEIARLEEKIKKLRQAPKKGDGASAARSTDPSQSPPLAETQKATWERGEVQRLRGQVATIDLEIVATKRENASTARTIEEIQRKVERLPQREQEMIALTRDYDNIRRSYAELLEKKLKANISENLEEKQKGERFQVLEPASLPNRPVKPDRLKVLALAFLVSLVIGAGGPIAFEVLDPRLRGSRDFKNFFDLPILASLPLIQDERYRRWIAVRRAAVVGGLVSISGAYAVFLLIHGKKVLSIFQSAASALGGKF